MNTYKTTLINLAFKDPDFHGFKWVLKVLTREMSSFKLDVLKIENDLIVSTDGHRLHIYYTRGLFSAGTYKVLIKTRTQIILEKVFGINYPEWHQVLTPKGTIGEMKIERIDSVGYTEIVRSMNKESTLRFDYFSDLASEMTKVFIPATSEEGLTFENFDGSMKALIMPMRA